MTAFLAEGDPIEAFCYIGYGGKLPRGHDPQLPYNTHQKWSICQRCGYQIWRRDHRVLWVLDHHWPIEEWP